MCGPNPLGRPNPRKLTFEGDWAQFDVDPALADQVRATRRETQIVDVGTKPDGAPGSSGGFG